MTANTLVGTFLAVFVQVFVPPIAPHTNNNHIKLQSSCLLPNHAHTTTTWSYSRRSSYRTTHRQQPHEVTILGAHRSVHIVSPQPPDPPATTTRMTKSNYVSQLFLWHNFTSVYFISVPSLYIALFAICTFPHSIGFKLLLPAFRRAPPFYSHNLRATTKNLKEHSKRLYYLWKNSN